MAGKIDWESVEREYRAGIRSLRGIGGDFGCTEGAIRRRAKADGWERDLSARIEAKTEALVRKSETVRKKVRNAEELANDDAIVDANAQVRAEAINTQATLAQRQVALAEWLCEDFEAQVEGREYIDQMIEALGADENTDRLAQAARKVIAFPVRVESFKKLVEASRTAVELQRKVLRIKDDSAAEDFAKKFGEGLGESLSASEAYKRLLG